MNTTVHRPRSYLVRISTGEVSVADPESGSVVTFEPFTAEYAGEVADLIRELGEGKGAWRRDDVSRRRLHPKDGWDYAVSIHDASVLVEHPWSGRSLSERAKDKRQTAFLAGVLIARLRDMVPDTEDHG